MAICLPSLPSDITASNTLKIPDIALEIPDDPDEIDAFFSERGFEWINISQTPAPVEGTELDEEEDKFGEFLFSSSWCLPVILRARNYVLYRPRGRSKDIRCVERCDVALSRSERPGPGWSE